MKGQALTKRKIELETISKRKKTRKTIRAYQKQIALFTQLNFDDEQVLKQLLHQVIQKIEVHQEGSIKIHYNIANP